jgi:predicted ATPase
VLGLLTVLMDREHPNIILLDDLDHGLHPRAQRDLVGLLRKFLEDNPETQIVFTTHSPYLLDSLRPEEVLLTTLNDDGSASCAALVDHPDFDRWKDEMSPGEMWTLFGESWAATLKA